MDLLREFELERIKDIDRPRLSAGDIVRVSMKVTEGDKTRVQIFEGTVIGIRGGGPSVTFTVRRETGKFAVERIFPLYNPLIVNIEIVRRQKVRRAKLGYLRQAGRRRVKEDERAMKRYGQEEATKVRLAEEKQKMEAEKQAKAEAEASKASPSTELRVNEANEPSDDSKTSPSTSLGVNEASKPDETK